MVLSSSSLTSGTLPSSPSFFSNDRSLPSLNPIAPSPSLPAIRSSALAVTSRSKGRRCLIRRMNVSKGDGSETAPSDMIFVPILEDGVFRFDSSVEHRNAAFPSVSFKNSKDREVPIPSHIVPAFTPTYSLLEEQQVVTFQFSPGTSFYGTGEVGGQLERTGKRVFTWNTDAWGYGPGTTSLYQSHPWVLVVLPTGETLGVLADTTRKCEIDLRKQGVIRIISPPSYPIITFGPFSTPTAVLQSLSHAVGTVFMPPKWALGYHQCRWSYMSDKRVAEIAQTFRDKKIPSDVIWMDIDYMDGFRCFTFDKERFPDPSALAKHLHNNGFKAIWMLDPGIKQEEGFDVYDSGSKNNVWVKGADGEPFIGEVWPGPCVFPDYTNSKARSWWANLVKDFISNGVDGIWNDMNEPAVFKVVTKTMPENNIHRGDDELGGVQYHSHYHNVYGMLMARSTYEGMELADKNKRPFVLTRAGFIGSQRYAATWTGDNLSTWEHLHMSISMVLQLGLSGQPLSGPDIGGFAGNATPRLFGRWMGVGAMFPFCRGHSEAGTDDHEPWSFGEECEEVCRAALKRRYQLLPHFYTLFYIAHTTGAPVATPIFFADPKDSRLRTIENAFLLGSLLIQASTLSNQGSHELQPIMPRGTWLRFDFEDSHPDLPTLYLQGGSIIALGPPHLHVGESSLSDDLTLLVSLDENGKAVGLLFEDDGDGYGYTEGRYLITHYIAERQSSVVTVKILKTEGEWERPKISYFFHSNKTLLMLLNQRQSLVTILRVCTKNGLSDQGRQVHCFLLKLGSCLDLFTSNYLIDMYSKCREPIIAHKVFDKMPERSVVSWTALMSGHVLNGELNGSLSLFSEMVRHGVSPNEFTLSTNLKACGLLNALEKGLQIHGFCLKMGFETMVEVGNSLVDMYSKCGGINEAERVFGSMVDTSLITWNAMIAGYVHSGYGGRALDTFRMMRERPDKFTLTSLLKACSSIGMIHGVW